MRINNNMMAMNTHRQLGIANASGAKSMSKLSSGMRINSAADDAAGLSISEKMRGQIRGLNQASRNAQDGISMIQTAEGALQETESILQRMRELSVQAANETLATEDRTAIGTELKQLSSEIDRIATDTKFNGKTLLNGELAGAQVDTAISEVEVGTTLSTTNDATVSSIDLTGAKSGETYTFSGSGSDLTLTRSSDKVAQTITVSEISAGGTSELNFSELGVKLTLGSAPGKASADIVTDLIAAGSNELKTSTASTTAKIHIGSDSNQDLSVTFGDMTTAKLGTTPGSTDLETLVTNVAADSIVSTNAKANTLIEQLDVAIGQVSTQRSEFGAVQNRLEHTIKNLDTSSENLQASESRIRDVDMAKEMMELTKNNILQQAAQAMLAQANQAPQGVLQLLR